MSKVRKTDACWLFTGYRNPNGYGMLTIYNRMLLAHRVAYEYFVGPITNGLCVCHHCDTPACVNPSHLFLGTQKDNALDRTAKGRNKPTHGELHGGSKLTAEQVLDIRRSDSTNKSLAHRFGVSASLVSMIKNRRTWTHI